MPNIFYFRGYMDSMLDVLEEHNFQTSQATGIGITWTNNNCERLELNIISYVALHNRCLFAVSITS